MIPPLRASGKGLERRAGRSGEVAVEVQRVRQRSSGGLEIEMTLALFFTQPETFSGSWVELVGTITLITLLVSAYKHFECHVSKCHRVGRFVHGHYKLCHVHHPHVPDSGKITKDEIDAVQTRAP
jgi:hypothetical protein